MISRDSRIVWILDRADVERLPDKSEIWRGSWTVVDRARAPADPNRADPVPRQNRVTPLGELIADPARGLVYGNRGCLHDGAGRIRRRYNGKRWIACRLSFRGWHRAPLMQPGRFTELFFLDEATAFAAGHRPCALCRREDYDRFVGYVAPDPPGADGRGCDRRAAPSRTGRPRDARASHARRAPRRAAGRRVRVGGRRAPVGARYPSASLDAVRLPRRRRANVRGANDADHAPVVGRGPAHRPQTAGPVPARVGVRVLNTSPGRCRRVGERGMGP